MKKYCSFLLLLTLDFYFSQQTDGLRLIKEKYDAEVQTIHHNYTEAVKKVSIKKLAKITLKKDSHIASLKFKRNTEYLEEMDRIKAAYKPSFSQSGTGDQKNETVTSPTHPKGLEFFKSEIGDNFYTDIISGTGRIECKVYFVVEKDGSILSVKAIGKNEVFNRQAELAVLLTPEKWEPATKNNQPEVSYMSFPVAINFD